MKTLLKIILTPIVLITIYVLGIFPIYMLGWITEPIDYFLGFALIVITIVFKDGLSGDHCAVIGIMGFITMISGVRLSTYSDD